MKLKLINHTPNPDLTVYQAARCCYMAGDVTKVADTDQEKVQKFIDNLVTSGHESPLEHCSFTFAVNGVSRVVTHELVRHRIASYCLAGDMEIPSYKSVKGRSCKSRTIEKIYQWYKSGHPAFKSLVVRCIDEITHKIVPGKIEKVFYNGEQDVYSVKTESGREVKCTMQHHLFTEFGWQRLQDLSVNDYIFANGLPLLENEDWLRHNYLTLNRTRKSLAGEIGCCETIIARAFKRFGIKKPHTDYPNRRGYRGKRPSPSTKTRLLLSLGKRGENNPAYKVDRSLLSLSGGYGEAIRKYSECKKACEFCGSINRLEIHHVDRNPKNNAVENIKILCSECHHLWHHPKTIGAFKDKIVSITYVGRVKVYDLQMAGQNHNYVANGIVVHNCQQSQRYVNYSEKDIEGDMYIPLDIRESPAASETYKYALHRCVTAYNKLIEAGIKPQDARYILPNAMMTQLVCTFNARSLLNFFKLRCCRRAQPEMQELAYAMLAEVRKVAPVIFQHAGRQCETCTEERKCHE